MKKIGILGSMLGASLLQIMAHGGWETSGRTATHAQNRRQRKSLPTGRYLYLPADRTTDARHWHNPANPHQAARIEAAAAKRARRAMKLRLTASALPNRAHLLSYNRNALNPFYIAK